MKRNGIYVVDSFAEAFPMKVVRLVITADSMRWARAASDSMTGFATSVIACGVEAGIERTLNKDETPDGRVGVSVLVFSMSSRTLGKQLVNRVGQCVMTSPTSAIYEDSCEGEVRHGIGKALRYFGDGHQIAKQVAGRRVWRIPVMEGEFVCCDGVTERKAIGGGNFLILAKNRAAALAASETAVHAMQECHGIILPFPGGVVRSGSKVGSRYAFLPASTNDAYCPTLKGVVSSQLPDEVGSVLEIVINGIDEEHITKAMRAGIHAILQLGANSGVVAIDAGNYGGKLGPHHFHLRTIVS